MSELILLVAFENIYVFTMNSAILLNIMASHNQIHLEMKYTYMRDILFIQSTVVCAYLDAQNPRAITAATLTEACPPRVSNSCQPASSASEQLCPLDRALSPQLRLPAGL